MSLNEFHELIRNLAQKAVDADRHGQTETACFYYMEASQAIIDFKQRAESLDANLSANLNSRLKEYILRAEKLKAVTNSSSAPAKPVHTKSQFQKDIEKGLYLLNDAIDEDSDGNLNEALNLYTSAIELYISIKKANKVGANPGSIEDELFKRLQTNVNKALERAEEIKNSEKMKLVKKSSPTGMFKAKTGSSPGSNSPEGISPSSSETDFSKLRLNDSADGSGSTGGSFTQDELNVLRNGSNINGRSYVPFFPHIDAKERFSFSIPFTDKDGKLILSPSQRERFSKWVRPDEIFEKPELMMMISPFSVKQTCISDCSFVASLTVCAQYERKFNKRILSRIIYPQDKRGDPVYNPCGKYMISLNLNGCQRKIIIDDYLPIDSSNQLLCSITTNRGELWVSLLEKAYMKVMGGYDFPGSNSNIDLHALTSWIPERLAIKGQHTDFNPNVDFERMFERLHNGDCLITVSTGHMSKADEERTGLVTAHAYAVLDIRKLGDKRLLQIKNPWSHLRWRGNYSEYDVTNWTPELKAALNYDPKQECLNDKGVFWIDYDSLLKFFDVFYLSWNPGLFPYTNVFHRKWSWKEGPIKDRYNLGDNPQYVLKLNPNPNTKKCTTWLLLTRHITDKADFADNKEYIALIVYKNGGKRVYYPTEPAPYKEGVRINSPHYLVKLVDEISQPLFYTFVVCQYEKHNSIFYTLRAYSTTSFSMCEIKEPYKPQYSKSITGVWKGISAGGCTNNMESYKNNPTYQVVLRNSAESNCIKIELKGPQEYSVGFDVECESSNVPNSSNGFKSTSSGDFRRGYCILTLNNIPGGTYIIRPCTYLARQEGPFFLEIESTHEFTLSRIN